MNRFFFTVIITFSWINFIRCQECFFFPVQTSIIYEELPDELLVNSDSSQLIIYAVSSSRNMFVRKLVVTRDYIIEQEIKISGVDTTTITDRRVDMPIVFDSLQFVQGTFEISCNSITCNKNEFQYIFFRQGGETCLISSNHGCLFDLLENYPFFFSAYNTPINLLNKK